MRVCLSSALKISSICVASSVRLTPSVPPSGIDVDVLGLGVGDVGRRRPSETGAACCPGFVPEVSST